MDSKSSREIAMPALDCPSLSNYGKPVGSVANVAAVSPTYEGTRMFIPERNSHGLRGLRGFGREQNGLIPNPRNPCNPRLILFATRCMLLPCPTTNGTKKPGSGKPTTVG